MEDDRPAEPVARQDEVLEEVAAIVVAVVGNVEEAVAGCKREAFAADSNIAAVGILAGIAGLAGHNRGIEDAKAGRTGQKLAGAGSGAGLVAAAALAVVLAAALAAALAVGPAVGPAAAPAAAPAVAPAAAPAGAPRGPLPPIAWQLSVIQ